MFLNRLPLALPINRRITTLSFLLIVFLCSCNNNEASVKIPTASTDSINSVNINLPENALLGLDVVTGLEIRTMATEPMLKNPTNMDVDDKGRIWITEAYNYRPEINGNPTHPEGDRILILEDKNGDGVIDTSKIFFQGPELNAPLGICVLGKRVLVSQSPYVWSFYDDDGDDKADRKEILFQGIGGEQHDHGVHSFTFGPDGKLYFSFGNEGATLKDKNGKVVRDLDGDEIGPKKYKEGMVFRCNPDGSEVECMGNNFRNNYEAAVDSYGTIWQSDNDDDGNRSTRINYVMDYGNYGYKDEITGASWQSNRTNVEDSIPLKHWHLNDPGVIPNLLQTGAGSPTGMVIYEGSLLPAVFHDGMIHCDPGPNIVRAYPVKNVGAGYSATIENIVDGQKHQWFRPADICVAPDGSLIIADWYDPGVGGHQAGDQQRGRIYRVAPPGPMYQVSAQDYSTVSGAITALQNPNLATRYLAWTALQQMGEKAVPELENLWRSSPNQRMKARAFWVLAKMPGGEKYIAEAIKETNPDLRIMGLRAARQLKQDVIPIVTTLANDHSPQVRRECALALRHNKSAKAAELWAVLAKQYDGEDRWYLEALGISADRQWDRFFDAYLRQVPDPLQTAGGRDIVWRARTEIAVPFLAKLAADDKNTLTSRLRYFRAFDFNAGASKSKFLLQMMKNDTAGDINFTKLVLHHLDYNSIQNSALAKKKLKEVVASVNGTPEYIELVRQYRIKTENKALLQLAIEKAEESMGRNAAGLLLQLGGSNLVKNTIQGNDSVKTANILTSLGGVGTKESIDILQNVALTKSYRLPVRSKAAEMMGRSMGGEDRVLALLKNKTINGELILPAVTGLKRAWRKAIYTEATAYLPKGATIAEVKTATIAELNALKGVALNGRTIFVSRCAPCHQVKKEGVEFGPDLSEIGTKLPREALLDAMVRPSAGISFGFETWQLTMKDGSIFTGIISSKTESDIDLKLPGGTLQKVKASDVKTMDKLPQSLMPEGLHQGISTQQLADLIEYMASLKKA